MKSFSSTSDRTTVGKGIAFDAALYNSSGDDLTIHEREIGELRKAGRATDERLNALINVVDKQISERRNGES